MILSAPAPRPLPLAASWNEPHVERTALCALRPSISRPLRAESVWKILQIAVFASRSDAFSAHTDAYPSRSDAFSTLTDAYPSCIVASSARKRRISASMAAVPESEAEVEGEWSALLAAPQQGSMAAGGCSTEFATPATEVAAAVPAMLELGSRGLHVKVIEYEDGAAPGHVSRVA